MSFMSVVCSLLNLGHMEEETEDYGKSVALMQTYSTFSCSCIFFLWKVDSFLWKLAPLSCSSSHNPLQQTPLAMTLWSFRYIHKNALFCYLLQGKEIWHPIFL